MRKTSEEIEIIKRKHNVEDLYSWSRYNCYKTSPYEYFLKYVKKTPEDRHDGIYGISGNVCHNILEKYSNNEIKYEDMIREYEDELFNMTTAELKYCRTDKEKNDKIAKKYEDCIRHFFRNYQQTPKKGVTEKFVLIKVGKYLFQSYIDFMHKEKGILYITDFKTSTIYKGKKIDKEKGQLLLYAEGIRQLGVPLENIIIRWNFLKYVTIEVPQLNTKIVSRNIERSEIGSSLKSNVEMWLKKSENNYTTDEINDIIETMIATNTIEYLPEEIKSKYEIKNCYVEIPLSQEIINELLNEVVDTIDEIVKKEKEYKKTKDDNIWDEEITDENSFYHNELSGYSTKLHKPYKRYMENRESNWNNKNKTNDEKEDMSWLNDL